MITTIWILKGAIALIFTFTGICKTFVPKAELIFKGMKGLINLDKEQIELVGLLEVLGAFGLVMPSLANYLPVLSAISAICLSLTMIVAGVINYKLKLSIIPNIVIFIICILIPVLELKYL